MSIGHGFDSLARFFFYFWTGNFHPELGGKCCHYVHKVKLFMASTWYLISSPVPGHNLVFGLYLFVQSYEYAWLPDCPTAKIYLILSWTIFSQVESSRCPVFVFYSKSGDTCVCSGFLGLNHIKLFWPWLGLEYKANTRLTLSTSHVFFNQWHFARAAGSQANICTHFVFISLDSFLFNTWLYVGVYQF